jgi:hypothetical protein
MRNPHASRDALFGPEILSLQRPVRTRVYGRQMISWVRLECVHERSLRLVDPDPKVKLCTGVYVQVLVH